MAVEERERFLRRVKALQACVRGHLIRKKFQHLKGEYESIVKQIEGNLGQLQWSQHSIPKPVFLSKSAQTPNQGMDLNGQEAGFNKEGSAPTKERKLSCQEMLQTETEHDCEMQLPSRLLNEMAVEGGAGDVRPDPEHPAAEPLGNAHVLLGENTESIDCSNVSSEWGSLVLDTESPRLSHVSEPETELVEPRVTNAILWTCSLFTQTWQSTLLCQLLVKEKSLHGSSQVVVAVWR
ncbi:IQ domain-containing protein C isoform X1 [Sphaerodactylus townsendi]|uniref:IQ domain-containing protein C isoform X1 n=1 Tax=Sphaerodactylus townsendi TaxID=933632 RepID=UPI0020264A07|nr:IQ domain-containing protein C isoform X1 [Sphaerodactylus townsendi]